MIRVLAAKNDAPFSSAQLNLLSRHLPSQVISAAGRYKRWQDAQAFLWGRYLLTEGLQYFGFEKNILPDIQYTTYNRPYLPVPLDFNISHSGDYIVCAFTDNKTGIDIEAIRPVDINDFSSCFSANELSAINNAPDIYDEFFRCWTIKEAVIKADGRGLSLPLETISVSEQIVIEGNSWFIHKIDIARGYQAHLATNEATGQGISIEWVSLPMG